MKIIFLRCFAALLLLCPLLTSAQSTFTGQPIPLDREQMAELDNLYNDYEAFYLDISLMNDYVKSKQSRGSVPLRLQIGSTYDWEMNLEPVEMYTPDCQIEVHTPSGSYFEPCGPTDMYQGQVARTKGGEVEWYLSPFRLRANVKIRGQQHMITRLKDVLPDYPIESVFLLVKQPVVATTEVTDDCTDDRIYGFDGIDHYLEIGLDADFSFYNKFKNIYPDQYIQRVREEMGGNISAVYSIYLDYFDLFPRIRHYNIWATSDPYANASGTSIVTPLRSYWNANKECVQRDWVHLFTSRSMGYDGFTPTRGAICNDPFDCYSVSVHRNHLSSRFSTVAHELGHGFNANELENDDDCSGLCDGDAPHPIMCTSGYNLSPFPWEHFFVKPSQFWIINHMLASAECLLEPFDYPEDCPRCTPTLNVVSNNPNPTVGCGDEDIVELTVTVCNDCQPRTMLKLRLYNYEEMELLSSDDYGDFDTYSQPSIYPHSLELESIPFDALECKTFTASYRAVGVSINNVIPYGAALFYQDPPSNDYAPKASVFRALPGGFTSEIDGTQLPSPTVSELILNGGLENNSIGCSESAYQKLRISGTLEVDQLYHISNSSRVIMESGAEIVVKDGGQLVICENSQFYGCSEMWKGITVEDGGELLLVDAEIRDAEFAIKALSGSTVGVVNSALKDNYVGIYVPPSTDGSYQAVNFPVFFGNNIESSSSMLAAYPDQTNYSLGPYAGMQLNDLESISVGAQFILPLASGPVIVPLPGNEFSQLGSGIIADNTSLQIINTNFRNIHAYQGPIDGKAIQVAGDGDDWLFQQGMTHKTTSFDNCIVGIKASGMNLDVFDNEMRNVWLGIDVSESPNRDVHIHDNDIEASIIGLRLLRNAPLANGAIENNEITVDGNSIGQGIYIEEVPAVASGLDIRGNTIVLGGASKGIYHLDGRGSLIRSNTIVSTNPNSFHGISLQNSPEVRVNNNAITGSGIDDPQQQWDKIAIKVDDSPSCLINCNVVDETTIGINFYGDCGNGNTLFRNQFRTHKEGLVFGRYFPGGFADGTVTFSPQIDAGNIWTTAYASNSGNTNLGAQHLGDAIPEQFIVDELEDFTFMPLTSAGDGNWFQSLASAEITGDCRRSPTGLPNVKAAGYRDEIQLIAYPNPVHKSLMINFELPKAERSEISLINQLGQSVKTHSLLPDSRQLQLDVSELATGVYQLVLFVDGSPAAYQTIVIAEP